MSKQIKTLKQLKNPSGTVHVCVAPPLECERPHAKLARLGRELEETTTAIQALKSEFAKRNINAQRLRQAVSTAEITAHQAEHARLSAKLLSVQTELADVNRKLRATKAAKHGNPQPRIETPVRRNGIKQVAPMKKHSSFPSYFMLAAEAELDAKMFQRIVAVGKAMLGDAITNGIEE
jgi:hypothetical protein